MKHRKERMEQEIITPPTFNNPYLERETKNNLQNNCISLSNKKKFPHIQQAGEQYAHQRLQEFLYHDYSGYLYHIGRPLESTKSCSRLSIFLTYGNLSLRQVVQYTKNRRQELAHIRDNYKKGSHEYKKQSSLVKHIDGFTSRLHRHDHFIQKLESDTNYEFKNIHHYYDRIRTTPNQKLITAWETGQTGYPLIDAAMRCLQTTGRVNFRLRATLISFICNTCMQDRKYPAHVLAKVFTDYEPGIHYSQCQMQA
jgi:deoxyribodipyrimidine photo-lyase